MACQSLVLKFLGANWFADGKTVLIRRRRGGDGHVLSRCASIMVSGSRTHPWGRDWLQGLKSINVFAGAYGSCYGSPRDCLPRKRLAGFEVRTIYYHRLPGYGGL